MQRAVALILGAGRGERLGEALPKALVEIAGRSLVEWSARALARARGVLALQPVLPEEHRYALEAVRHAWSEPAQLLPAVAGGPTRQASVALGLEAARAALPEVEWVLVHDAARCLVTPDDAEQVLAAAQPTGAALPVLPVSDTVKRVASGRVLETLDRDALGLALTPQAFRAALLAEALEKAERDGVVGTDCASLVERLAVEVRTCAGRPGNFKVTRAGDLERAAAQLGARRA
jgi:2-C-methyl-D-erythritol 4-phosphate cytidylyltransferase/2-C-methyl-D-erythritol 2,4-cyclodiphosphate synthase